jgi:hypothetical protein
MHIEQVTGILETYIICDYKDSPLYNDEVLVDVYNIGPFQHDEHDNTEYCSDNNVDEDTTETEEEVESSFISFWLFYERFLEIMEQLKVEHFTTIRADKKHDAVASELGNLEKELRELSCMELTAKKNTARRQMTLNDFHVRN